jgi:hypothetical protein
LRRIGIEEAQDRLQSWIETGSGSG